MRPQKRGPRAASSTPFLGQAVAKLGPQARSGPLKSARYDVDELDDLNKQRSKRERPLVAPDLGAPGGLCGREASGWHHRQGPLVHMTASW